MSIAMRALLTRVGKAAEAAVRQNAAGEDLLTRRVATVDQWIAEEEWLAGLPSNRNEHFGRLWWRGSLNEQGLDPLLHW
jgi:hypothetical protein